MENITEFLGWSTIVNSGLLLFSTVMLVVMRKWVAGFHGRLFGLSETDLSKDYFQFLANYKIAILIFNLVPYIALKIMGN